jgi:Chagasin family peptidase inhibitor I42
MQLKMILFLLSVFTFGCTPKKMLSFQIDDKDSLTTKCCKPFSIELISHTGGGYSWKIKDSLDPSFLRYIKKEEIFVPFRQSVDSIIKYSKIKFYFKPLKKGTTIFKMEEARSWEMKPSTIKSIQIFIN